MLKRGESMVAMKNYVNSNYKNLHVLNEKKCMNVVNVIVIHKKYTLYEPCFMSATSHHAQRHNHIVEIIYYDS